MQLEKIKEGEKATFLWHPGYRGQIRDGETVIVLNHEENHVKVRFRFNQSEIVPAQYLQSK